MLICLFLSRFLLSIWAHKAGLRVVAFLFLPTGVFFVTEDACDEPDDDWFKLSPVLF
jgi:hypothetical protein